MFKKNQLVKNTLILIICSLFIKALGLLNRIVLTNLLGMDGISLYMISIPTVMLFISIGGLSLNIVISKITSENILTKIYNNKIILKKAILIGFISSLITSLILIIIAKPLANDWLKQPDSYYPILATITFIPIVMLNNVFRGYFNGLNKISFSAIANIIEQVSRIIFSIAFLYLFLPYGIIIAVSSTIIAMAIGELISFIYILILYFKYKHNPNSSSIKNPTNEILKTSIPTTLSRLIGNFTYFLEPIIYTFALTLISFTPEEIKYNYSVITAYALPLITLFSFIPVSISTVIIPNIASSYATNNKLLIHNYVKKSILLSFLPGILITLILTFYAKEYMYLLYKTDIGSSYVSSLSIFFILFYIQAPLISIMQAIGKANISLLISLIGNSLKLIMLFLFVFIKEISYNSLIISLIINVNLSTLIYYFYVKNKIGFKFSFLEISNTLLITIISLIFTIFINKFTKLNYIIASLLITIVFILSYFSLRTKNIRNK